MAGLMPEGAAAQVHQGILSRESLDQSLRGGGTRIFPALAERVHDWNFANRREDARPVFHPYHADPGESFGWFLAEVAAAHELIRDGHVE